MSGCRFLPDCFAVLGVQRQRYLHDKTLRMKPNLETLRNLGGAIMKEFIDELFFSGHTRCFLCPVVVVMMVLLQCATVVASECQESESLPPREDSQEYTIAVKQSANKFLICHENDLESPYKILSKEKPRKLKLFWAIPSYKKNEKQVVYVRSSYSSDQPFSLSRNATLEIPLPFFKSLPLFKKFEKELGEEKALSTFRKYHQDQTAPNLDKTVRKALSTWHDTRLWGLNKSSYEVVQSTIRIKEGLWETGTAERLISVRANRPFVSWIEIDAWLKKKNLLKIMAVYSGDTSRIWFYYFQGSP